MLRLLQLLHPEMIDIVCTPVGGSRVIDARQKEPFLGLFRSVFSDMRIECWSQGRRCRVPAVSHHTFNCRRRYPAWTISAVRSSSLCPIQAPISPLWASQMNRAVKWDATLYRANPVEHNNSTSPPPRLLFYASPALLFSLLFSILYTFALVVYLVYPSVSFLRFFDNLRWLNPPSAVGKYSHHALISARTLYQRPPR